MVRELVTEQERLVRALQERQEESHSVARLGNTLVTRVGSLKAQLEVVMFLISSLIGSSVFSQFWAINLIIRLI